MLLTLLSVLLELMGSILSPQGCLLQRGLCAQPGACREHQVLDRVVCGYQRGWEHLSTVHWQPQHPGTKVRELQGLGKIPPEPEVRDPWGQVRDPQPILVTATSGSDRCVSAPWHKTPPELPPGKLQVPGATSSNLQAHRG